MSDTNQITKASTNIDNQSLIFIPDISGFTKFVNDTAIEHSQHIIKELLEIIIDANQIGLNVSEIEGDAVLFYILNDVPGVQDVVEQSKEMFLKFHRHLKLYERDRICECGACSTAHKLTLKIFVHSGTLRELQVKDHSKLIGTDLILAHRLMKNSIDSDEYLLLTDHFLRHNSYDMKSTDWIKWASGKDFYDDLGDVTYQYSSMEALHQKIGPLPARATYEKTANPITYEFIVNAPLPLFHRILTEIDYKPLISKGSVEVEYDKEHIPRVGTLHQCKLPSGYLEIRAIENRVDKDERLFAERIENFPIFKKANVLYSMIKSNEKTHFKVDLHYAKTGFIGRIKSILLRPLIKKQFRNGIQDLVNFANEVHAGRIKLD